jgi:DNA-binding transcriptional LysR family regulator
VEFFCQPLSAQMIPAAARHIAMNWEDLKYFLALARRRTLAEAARALRVNHATVSRRVESLETSVGRPLFDRRAEGYLLNVAGRMMLDEARAMERAALILSQQFEAKLEGELTGEVRLATFPALADGYLVERLGTFRSLHPDLLIELIADVHPTNLLGRDADFAIRSGRINKGELTARELTRVGFGFFCSKQYRDLLREGEQPAFIGFDRASNFIPEAAWLAENFSDERFLIRCNGQLAQAIAAREGLGIALLPRYIGLGGGGLVQVDLRKLPPDNMLSFVTRVDETSEPRISAVLHFVLELFEKDRDLFCDIRT